MRILRYDLIQILLLAILVSGLCAVCPADAKAKNAEKIVTYSAEDELPAFSKLRKLDFYVLDPKKANPDDNRPPELFVINKEKQGKRFVLKVDGPYMFANSVVNSDGTANLSNGATGATGQQGLKGERGDAGPAGAQGLKGDPGAQGVKGDTGAQGPIGPAGPQGPVGPAGPQGPTGPSGPAGPQGPQGNPDASQIFTGTLDDARLSGNVVLKNNVSLVCVELAVGTSVSTCNNLCQNSGQACAAASQTVGGILQAATCATSGSNLNCSCCKIQFN